MVESFVNSNRHDIHQEDECPFAHSGSVDKKPEMCKFYLNAHCAKGKACIFMHEDYPCKFFHLGMTCYSGSDCKFSHAPLDAVTGPMIEKVSTSELAGELSRDRVFHNFSGVSLAY